jgi:CRP-like cAMP-binding protein
MITQIINFLEIELYKPEDEIIKQGDESYDMYFMSNGVAFAKKRDKLGKEKSLNKRFDHGCHFGDISLYYECPRTATIVAGDFCTIAKLSKESYTTLI